MIFFLSLEAYRFFEEDGLRFRVRIVKLSSKRSIMLCAFKSDTWPVMTLFGLSKAVSTLILLHTEFLLALTAITLFFPAMISVILPESADEFRLWRLNEP